MNIKKSAKNTMCGLLSLIMGAGSLSVCAFGASPNTITVGKGGGYNYATVTEALQSIDYVPSKDSPVIIEIGAGTYEEFISVDLPYITMEAENPKGKVVLTYDKAVGHTDTSKRAGTEKTASFTLTANAKDFKAKNITFQNSYNLVQEEEYSQAVAFCSNADRVVLEDCTFIGRQDTLYLKGASQGANVSGSANPARTYLKNCYIEGTVDFIFGDGTAYFENCDINMAYRAKGGGYFTAPNTTLYNVGYVFDGCRFTVDSKYTDENSEDIYLGRPWQCDADHPNSGSNTVIMNSELPSKLNTDGFKLWNEKTQANKVRFMEYNNTVNRAAADTSKRADFVKILTKEQAENFKPFNILRGDDMWNPASFGDVVNSPAAMATLGSYDISLPLGESVSLKTYLVPLGSKGSLTYSSSDESIVKADKNGALKAQGKGSAQVSASLENGMSVSANVTVTSARTLPPTVKDINIENNKYLKPGERVRGSYSLGDLDEDATDTSLIRWTGIDPASNKEFVLTEGRGVDFNTYIVKKSDIGYKIKMTVLPECTTSYGTQGEGKSVVTEETVMGSRKNILQEGFDSIGSNMTVSADGDFEIIDGCISGASEVNSKEDRVVFNGELGSSYNAVLRMRFNPAVDGLSGDSYEDFYFNYADENNYYKLKITRGGNTSSLRWYIIKCENGTETILAQDEESMANNVMQNSAENNPWCRVTFTKNGGNLTAAFALEGDDKALSTLTVNDNAPFGTGASAFATYGKQYGLLLDYFNIYTTGETKEAAVRLFIAGDSSAKFYGNDNTIGGWGEYLPYYFTDDVEIINKAEGGRSSRSFINQGRLDEICNEAHKGDIVLIQFGINDGLEEDNYKMEYYVPLGEPDENGIYPYLQPTKVPTPQVLLDCYGSTAYPYKETYYPYTEGSFKWYLSQYVTRIRETGATPVLVSSICRVFFDENGKITPHHGKNDGYITAVEQTAEEMNCQYLDFYEITKDLYESYGFQIVQGLANIKADGTMDLSHYNKFGANIIASKFAEALKNANLGLEAYATASTADVERTDGLKKADLILVGDEYMADFTDDESCNVIKKAAIGQALPKYLSSLITVKCFGLEGETARSYEKTDKYNEFLNSVDTGDYVLIHFGTHDGEEGDGYSSPTGNKDVSGSFEYYVYNCYVKPVIEKNAIPIVLTPFAQREFDNEGNYTYTDKGYGDAIRELAVDCGLYFCNMCDNMSEIYKTAGKEKSIAYNAYGSESISDCLSISGAELAAKSFISSMQYSVSTFKDYAALPEEEEETYVTRGEFAERLVNALGLKGTGIVTFGDLPQGRTYNKACNLLKEYAIAEADENNCYYPENILTGEAFNKMMNKTVTALNIQADAPQTENNFVTRDEVNLAIAKLYAAKG